MRFGAIFSDFYFVWKCSHADGEKGKNTKKKEM